MKVPGDGQDEIVMGELIDALRADPLNTDHMYKLGRACESLGRLKEALDQFEAIVRLEPDDHEALHAVGLLHYKLGETDKAIIELRRATEIWDGQPDYFADLGDALYSAGDIALARHSYEKALTLSLPNEDIAERVRIALDRGHF